MKQLLRISLLVSVVLISALVPSAAHAQGTVISPACLMLGQTPKQLTHISFLDFFLPPAPMYYKGETVKISSPGFFTGSVYLPNGTLQKISWPVNYFTYTIPSASVYEFYFQDYAPDGTFVDDQTYYTWCQPGQAVRTPVNPINPGS